MSKIEVHNEKVDRSRLKLLGSLGLLAAFGALGGCGRSETRNGVRFFDGQRPAAAPKKTARQEQKSGGISAGGGD